MTSDKQIQDQRRRALSLFRREFWARQRTFLVCAALALITTVLYLPLRKADFINLDDSAYILTNGHIQQGINWRAFVWCFQAGYASNWHPLAWMSHMLDCQIYGLDPAGHHLTSVLLHAANAVLLFLVLQRLSKAFWRTTMVAALFAWHPVHVESVAWVSERKDVLSTLFWLLAIWAYANYTAKRGAGRYLLVLLLLALGLMAKPMVVTLPFVFLLLDWWPLGRFSAGARSPTQRTAAAAKTGPLKSWKFLVIEKIPFIALAAVSCVLTMIAQIRGQAVVTTENAPMFDRLLNALVSYARYLDKMVWPRGLSIIYPFRYFFLKTEVGYAAFVLLAVTAVAIALRKSRPYLAVGWFWYLGTLVPVIGLVQVGSQSFADRYTYIPSIGFFIMVCWAAHDLILQPTPGRDSCRGVSEGEGSAGASPYRASPRMGMQSRFRAPALAVAAVAVLTGCVLTTHAQLQYWKNSGTLFEHAIELAPDNYIAHYSYGAYLRDQNQLEKARAQCQKAVELAPRFAYCHSFLGGILWLQGQTNAAVEQLEISLQLMPQQPSGWVDLGRIRLGQQNLSAAADAFTRAVATAPNEPAVHALLGRTLALEGKLAAAEAEFAEALRLDPRLAEADYQLAQILSMEKKTAEAMAHYKAALASQPDFPDALNNLAWILAANSQADLRDGRLAVELASRACALTHDKTPMMIGTLAAAYAEAGKFDEAVTAAQKAHDIAGAQGLKSVAERNLELMKLYREGKAYHEK